MTVLIRVGVAGLLAAALGCEPVEDTSPTASTPSSGGVTQLQIVDLRAGTGLEATNGRYLTVRYTGWLYDASRAENKGAPFDSGTFAFFLGAGQVIRGWDQGVAGMRVGGSRRLIIPPSLGYGSQAVGTIPPNSTLVFDVELLDAR
jgi:FKBP-type peptidyl-prolyl cis-trans isomerase FkpA